MPTLPVHGCGPEGSALGGLHHLALLEHAGQLLPTLRGLLGASPPPSFSADPMRFEVLDLGSAFNSPPQGEGWDLSGLKPGRRYVEGLPYAIADPALRNGRSTVLVARRPGNQPTRVALPIRGRWAALVFVHAATGAGRPGIHAGDQTHFPRESSELLGYYEMRYEDISLRPTRSAPTRR